MEGLVWRETPTKPVEEFDPQGSFFVYKDKRSEVPTAWERRPMSRMIDDAKFQAPLCQRNVERFRRFSFVNDANLEQNFILVNLGLISPVKPSAKFVGVVRIDLADFVKDYLFLCER